MIMLVVALTFNVCLRTQSIISSRVVCTQDRGWQGQSISQDLEDCFLLVQTIRTCHVLAVCLLDEVLTWCFQLREAALKAGLKNMKVITYWHVKQLAKISQRIMFSTVLLPHSSKILSNLTIVLWFILKRFLVTSHLSQSFGSDKLFWFSVSVTFPFYCRIFDGCQQESQSPHYICMCGQRSWAHPQLIRKHGWCLVLLCTGWLPKWRDFWQCSLPTLLQYQRVNLCCVLNLAQSYTVNIVSEVTS